MPPKKGAPPAGPQAGKKTEQKKKEKVIEVTDKLPKPLEGPGHGIQADDWVLIEYRDCSPCEKGRCSIAHHSDGCKYIVAASFGSTLQT